MDEAVFSIPPAPPLQEMPPYFDDSTTLCDINISMAGSRRRQVVNVCFRGGYMEVRPATVNATLSAAYMFYSRCRDPLAPLAYLASRLGADKPVPVLEDVRIDAPPAAIHYIAKSICAGTLCSCNRYDLAAAILLLGGTWSCCGVAAAAENLDTVRIEVEGEEILLSQKRVRHRPTEACTSRVTEFIKSLREPLAKTLQDILAIQQEDMITARL